MGIESVNALFDEIPSELATASLEVFPEGFTEHEVSRLMMDRSPRLQPGLCFIGAGAYEHHIPKAVWEITMRGEFLPPIRPIKQRQVKGVCSLFMGISNHDSFPDGASRF